MPQAISYSLNEILSSGSNFICFSHWFLKDSFHYHICIMWSLWFKFLHSDYSLIFKQNVYRLAFVYKHHVSTSQVATRKVISKHSYSLSEGESEEKGSLRSVTGLTLDLWSMPDTVSHTRSLLVSLEKLPVLPFM